MIGALMLFAGCIGIDTQAPEVIQRDPAKMTVRVDVTGDATIGPATYGVLLDGFPVAEVTPNETHQIDVTTGPHYLYFSGPEPKPTTDFFGTVTHKSWCRPSSERLFKIDIKADGSSSLGYRADCPPLAGEARLLVTVTSGASSTKETRVYARRIIGPEYTLSQIIPLGKATELRVPVGVYVVSVGPPCELPYISIFSAPQEYLLRDTEWASASIDAECP
jgi:hypothetical protein